MVLLISDNGKDYLLVKAPYNPDRAGIAGKQRRKNNNDLHTRIKSRSERVKSPLDGLSRRINRRRIIRVRIKCLSEFEPINTLFI